MQVQTTYGRADPSILIKSRVNRIHEASTGLLSKTSCDTSDGMPCHDNTTDIRIPCICGYRAIDTKAERQRDEYKALASAEMELGRFLVRLEEYWHKSWLGQKCQYQCHCGRHAHGIRKRRLPDQNRGTIQVGCSLDARIAGCFWDFVFANADGFFIWFALPEISWKPILTNW